MSWIEYNDMFERAQEKGEYHLFVFDLKGSRSIGYFTNVSGRRHPPQAFCFSKMVGG